jgi:GMP synthase-like glutamine amidotransferase
MTRKLISTQEKITPNRSLQTSLLVIRHELPLHLGALQATATQCSKDIRFWNVSLGECLFLEELDNYSHLVILGGSMSVYEEEQYPFLRDEFRVVEAAIDRGMPTLGICLGSQILAHVLGARVYRGKAGREAGWCEVEMTDGASSDFLLRNFPKKLNVFQFHQDTFDLPSGAIHLAQSKKYTSQAFCYQHVWGIQFHLEFDRNLIRQCSSLLEHDIQHEKLEGISIDQMVTDAQTHDCQIAQIANQFMQNFLST